MAIMRNSLKLFLFLNFLFHFLLIWGFDLAHDEAYYWLFSKNLAWGYFDHPPFVALIIKLFSFLPQSEFAVRIGFLLMYVSTILVLLSLVSKEKRWLAFKLFMSFPLASSLGLFALPDMPLLFMSAVYLFCLKRYFDETNFRNSLLLSFAISGILYAKYHGILLIIFTLISNPKLLGRKSFYGIFFLSLLLFLPHITWQFNHDFPTIRYHFFERPTADFSVKRLFEFVSGQIFQNGLFVGPVIWFSAYQKKSTDQFERVLKFISFGSIIFFFVSILNKKFEANWTVYLSLTLILLVVNENMWEKKLVKSSLNISILLIILTKLVLVFNPQYIPIGRLKEFHGWKEFALEIKSKCSAPIVANTYQMASKLSFYLNQQIHSANLNSRKNQFDIWNVDSKLKDQKICFVTNRKNFFGEKIITPDSKNLIIVKNLDYNEIINLKNEK